MKPFSYANFSTNISFGVCTQSYQQHSSLRTFAFKVVEMPSRTDICALPDIELLVNEFYGKIRVNPLLGPIFNGIIGDRWPQHLEKMYRFWQTVLLEEHTYYGSPFHPHAKLPVEQLHFDTWLKLWHETVDSHFAGAKADEAKFRGDKMAALFLSKIEYYRENGSAKSII